MTASTSRDQQRREETDAMGTAGSPARRLAGQKRKLISDALALFDVAKKACTAVLFAARTTTQADDRELGEPLPEATEEGGSSQQSRGVAAAEDEELDLTGSRELMTAESATKLLELVLAVGSKVSKVKLSTKGVGMDAAPVVAKGLQNISKTLAEVDLSDSLAGSVLDDERLQVLRIICGALKMCKLLTHLDISENPLGEKGIRACADALAGQTLRGLGLRDVGCCIGACSALAELVEDASDLRQLDLFKNVIGDQGAVHIASLLARAPLMEDFRMASAGVRLEGGIALLQALSKGSNLVKLDISDNPMWEKIAPELAACLPRHPNLRVLNLNGIGLVTDEGVETVCKALVSACPGLEELHLAENEITPKGAEFVGRLVAVRPQLTRLVLRENNLENAGAETVCEALSACPNLKELDLSDNQIGEAGALAAAQAVVDKAGFELLGLNWNQVPEDAVDKVKELLERAFPGASVLGRMDRNDPPPAQTSQVTELLEQAFPGASVLGPKDANKPGAPVLGPKDANEPGAPVLDPKDANEPGAPVLGPKDANEPGAPVLGPKDANKPGASVLDPKDANEPLPRRGRTTKEMRRADALSVAEAAGPSN